MRRLEKRFWISLLLFGLIGQVAWVVENMYLNVFLYKMFHATAADISLMVAASAVFAALTTVVTGAVSDRLRKRKAFICIGYILWGITLFLFGLVRTETLLPFTGNLAKAVALGITLVILLDCVMTFFGSAANDACFNAWLTDRGDDSNRGRIEGLNAMMPLVAILVVFGGFMGFDLEKESSWRFIFSLLGGIVFLTGTAGFFLLKERAKEEQPEQVHSIWQNICYGFRPTVWKKNKLLYSVIGAFALFGVSIQIFMPYLILYYEQTLGMKNYVLILAPAIVIAAVVTALYGKLYDWLGFRTSIIPCIIFLVVGYIILFFEKMTIPVFVGSLLMMCGYLTGSAVFGAMIRDHTPIGRAGQFQGIRMIGQVLLPGCIGPVLGAFLLKGADQIQNQDGTYSFLPNHMIWLGAFLAAVILCIVLGLIFYLMRMGHYDLWTESGERLFYKFTPDGRLADAGPADAGLADDNPEDDRQEADDANKDSSPEEESTPWQSYPRPQLKREDYLILNGKWKLNRHVVRVPFPPQSLLSGYGRHVSEHLMYEKKFVLPASFTKKRVLLHFGAVDQVAEVWLNGLFVGRHEGGYLPFCFDVTQVIKRGEENCLQVKATDTLSERYPYGKQRKKRGGMWYTPVSGIWQSVWLENVPEVFIKNVVLKPDLEGVDIKIVRDAVSGTDSSGFEVFVTLENGEELHQRFEGMAGRFTLAGQVLADGSTYHPIYWTPENPHLYPARIVFGEDRIETYFALRTMEIRKLGGINRVCLNGKPIFLHGVLDQGYYSDGIYLPAEEAEYERDILRMKELGYNLLRKHIKIEPEYFYYACDRLGMLVMQDMVNNGHYSFLRDTALPTLGFRGHRDDRGNHLSRRKQFFTRHLRDTVRQLYNHPCIVAYTVFNEGWGQFESDRLYDYIKSLDDTRLADATSGWFAKQRSDFDSEHIYFKLMKPEPKERPLFISECGGYSYLIDGHYYGKYNHYGYGNCADRQQLTDTILKMYRKMILPAAAGGLCGSIYTQLSDVEDETNGLYTYDRKICKVQTKEMAALAKELQAAVETDAETREIG